MESLKKSNIFVIVAIKLSVQDSVKKIRAEYERDWKSKEMRLRQRYDTNIIHTIYIEDRNANIISRFLCKLDLT